MFGFPGGVTQTDWFGLASGVIGSGYASAAYNQAAYIANVQMRQAQIYQDKGYHLGWVDVARNDIRDMMNISVTRMNNYMLVATLILATAGGVLCVNFGPDVPTFIINEFWINMGLSILFSALSVCFTVKGQNSAFLNTMRLLTWELRPENPARYDHDYMKQAQQFERRGIGQILRLPGLRARYDFKRAGAKHDKAQKGRAGGSQSGPRASGFHPDGAATKPPCRETALEEVVPGTQHLVYLARFAKFMELWQPLDSQSRYCIGLCLVSFAHGAGTFSLGSLATSTWISSNYIAVAMGAIFACITLSIFHEGFHPHHAVNKVAGLTLFLFPSVFSTVAALIEDPPWVRRLFAPGAMLSHCCFYVVCFFMSLVEMTMPSEITEKWTTGPAGQKFPQHLPRDRQSPVSSASAHEEVEPARLEVEEAERVRIHARIIVRGAMLLAAVLWLLVSAATVLDQNPQVAWQVLRKRLRTMSSVEEVTISWPSVTVRPHALACSADGHVFMANEFQVFRLLQAPGKVSAVPEPCNVSGLISDVVSMCDRGTCWPSVLLKGGPPRLVACNTGLEMRLHQSRKHTRLIAAGGAQLLAWESEQGTLTEYHVAPHGWAPQWELGHTVEELASIDLDGDGSVMLFLRRHGYWNIPNVLVVRSLQDFSRGGSGDWQIPSEHAPLVAGCFVRTGSVLFLGGPESRLFRATMNS